MDEIYFQCEMCNDKFPATANAMIECKTDLKAIDEDTNQPIDIDEELYAEFLEILKKENPVLAPFLKGAVCLCDPCQQMFYNDHHEVVSNKKPTKKVTKKKKA